MSDILLTFNLVIVVGIFALACYGVKLGTKLAQVVFRIVESLEYLATIVDGMNDNITGVTGGIDGDREPDPDNPYTYENEGGMSVVDDRMVTSERTIEQAHYMAENNLMDLEDEDEDR